MYVGSKGLILKENVSIAFGQRIYALKKVTYSTVPNKRPVSNKRPRWKFLLKIGNKHICREYSIRSPATIIKVYDVPNFCI